MKVLYLYCNVEPRNVEGLKHDLRGVFPAHKELYPSCLDLALTIQRIRNKLVRKKVPNK